MQYKYALSQDWEDFASGRVLHNFPGSPAFPARLASEIYQRCTAILKASGLEGPWRVWDPCCGGAHLLTVLGFLHGNTIDSIYAGDISEQAVEFASKNLGLLSTAGLASRQKQLQDDLRAFGKPSHQQAAISAERLAVRTKESSAWRIHVACRDAADWTNDHFSSGLPEVLVTDLPYGNLVQWSGSSSKTIRVPQSWERNLVAGGIMAVVSAKKQPVEFPPELTRRTRFTIGHRQVMILQK